jgi:hypothetical protein
MNSQQLSDEVLTTVQKAQSRILGSGHEQYADDVNQSQKFEEYTLNRMFKEMEDEILDVINYGVMLNRKIKSLQARLALVDDHKNDLPTGD